VLLVVCSALTGCDGLFGGPGKPRPDDPMTMTVATECTTPAVFDALSTSCASCHADGSNRPYFSTLQSFEALIVAKPQWIVPGKPDEGQFLPILQGTASGTFAQMPPGEPSAAFAAQAEAGKTSISMATLRCWISGLTGVITPTPAGPLPVARRLSAEQMLVSLEQQLGISATGVALSPYGLSLPDAIPNTDVYRDRDENLAAIGGPHWLEQRRRNDSINPVFIQTFVNVSQSYCRLAVQAAAANNKVLKFATTADTSTSAPQKVRDNIKYLGKRLLSQQLSDADVNDYFELFRSLEPDRTAAWTGLCAAMVRDPLWLTY
jgi:hypothetical protein